MQIYIHHNQQQIGPFTEAEVKAQLTAGAILGAGDQRLVAGPAGLGPPQCQTALGGSAPQQLRCARRLRRYLSNWHRSPTILQASLSVA